MQVRSRAQCELRRVETAYGVMEVVTYADDAGRRPFVILHGFTEGPDVWRPVAELLAPQHPAFLLELPGHGLSRLDKAEGYDFEAQAKTLTQVSQTLTQTAPAPILIGYSMGGRLALAMAAASPQSFGALVLISAHPGLRTEAERTARIAEDARWAELCRNDFARFNEAWGSRPLLADIPREAATLRLAARRRHDRQHLAAALAGAGLGRQPDYRKALAELPLPVAFITGDRDEKFKQLADEMHSLRPDCAHLRLPAGHAVHAGAPAQLAAGILSFAEGCKAASASTLPTAAPSQES